MTSRAPTWERQPRRHLIFDADDTLWENNVVFEQITSDFVAWLRHPQGEDEARRIHQDINRALCQEHGYGTKTYIRALHETFERVSQRVPTEGDRAHLRRLVERLTWKEIEVIEGVPETLRRLRARNDLLLLTKGDPQEQQVKIRLSGLAPLFRERVIVREKSVATYQTLVADANLDPAATWMIGNSPRSDILPAVAAGLRAVFIPNPNTWQFEHDDLPDNPAILQLPRFAALLEHF
jgi:putative hydrolase of the HAD superfamily